MNANHTHSHDRKKLGFFGAVAEGFYKPPTPAWKTQKHGKQEELMLKTTMNICTTSSLPVLPADHITVRLVYVTWSFLLAVQTYPGKQPCWKVVLQGGSQVCRFCNCVRTSTVAPRHLLYRLHSYYNKNIPGTCRLLKWKT